MTVPTDSTPMTPRSLTLAWLALVGLSVVSALLGGWVARGTAVQLAVAAILWLKGALVARRFLESAGLHPSLRRVLGGFIAFAPLAIALGALFPDWLVRLTTL
ncbi:MAG: hypothetical protein KDG55_10630 [Rhodocyclaceae bacterium]|nr:hypothetical protein [Rhodocyclaceae bacterium]